MPQLQIPPTEKPDKNEYDSAITFKVKVGEEILEMSMESEPRNPEFYTCVADVTVPAAAGV